MHEITPKQLTEILRKHEAWRRGESDGECADLSGAHLSGADLSGAYLSRADLSGAYLSRADLSGADLSGAYLSDADLRRADLSDADLSDADLSGADLSGAKGIWIIGPGGSRGDMLYAVAHGESIMLKAGCFWGTPEEFRAAVAQTHGNTPEAALYLAKLALLEQMAAHVRAKSEVTNA